jgi:sulfhydrogenase subunit beta (sulfur reductase)
MKALEAVLDADAVGRLRETLARDRILYEVRRFDRGAEWERSNGTGDFTWDAPLPLEGVKRFFFPASETLLSWKDGDYRAERPEVAPFALFGVRACDLAALAYQDRFFAADPYYGARREQALVIGVNCLVACPGGFCVEVDAGPFAREGYDLALTRLSGDAVVVQVRSAAGRGALAAARITTRAPGDDERALWSRARERAVQSFVSRPFIRSAIARIQGRVDARPVADSEWQELGPSCFACTGCTSLCPTCSCFSIEDESRGETVERRRLWDSCLLEGFQREASGHHPAPRPGDRVQRFWEHKLGEEFGSQLGRIGCVGCGRCDTTCLGQIGATSVLGKLGGEW